jgi:protein-tyrosine-phosphatase
VTANVVDTTDLIVVMDPIQRRILCERFGRRLSDVLILGDFDPSPVETRTIRDPVNQSRAVFDQVYERIARCVREFARALGDALG